MVVLHHDAAQLRAGHANLGRDIPATWDTMTSEQRPSDEMANLLTQMLGFLLSLAATFLLMPIVMARHELRTTLACGVYCLTLVLLYGALTLSHAFRDRALRRMFRGLDEACIYLLIAGSMTPFALIFLRQGRWWLSCRRCGRSLSRESCSSCAGAICRVR